MQLKVKKLHAKSELPKYGKPGDAAMDLTITEISDEVVNDRMVKAVKFGIAIEVPEGHVGLLFPRSSIYKKNALLSNSVGVVDSNFRGELQAKFLSGDRDFLYQVGERAVQLIVLPIPALEVEEVDELSDTVRGEKGFGSSGE